MGEAGRAVLGKVAKEGRSASQDSQAWRQVRARFVPEGQAVCDDLTMQCNATPSRREHRCL